MVINKTKIIFPKSRILILKKNYSKNRLDRNVINLQKYTQTILRKSIKNDLMFLFNYYFKIIQSIITIYLKSFYHKITGY
jgi:hypothetical protein